MNKRLCAALAFSLFGAFILVAAEQALAEKTRIEVLYTDGQILDGPLSFGLDILPPVVRAKLILAGPVTTPEFGPADVLSIDLHFGDAHFTDTDLHPLSIVPDFVSEVGVIVTFSTLSYRMGGGSPNLSGYGQLAGIDEVALSDPCADPTATARCRISSNSNFELNLFGQDIDSGEPFHYQYTTSQQIGFQVPEPATWALLTLALALVACRRVCEHRLGR